MADTTIESLELELTSNAGQAVKGIDALKESLGRLKTATQGGLGLTSVIKQVKSLDEAASGINPTGVANLEKLAGAIERLKNVSGVKLSPTIARQITAIGDAVRGLNGTNIAVIGDVSSQLQTLNTVGKANLTSPINQLRKLSEVMIPLNSIDMKAFAAKIREVADAIRPLANEMNKVAKGFSAFPSKIQKLMNQTEKLPVSNAKASRSYIDLWAKLRMGRVALQFLGSKIAGFIQSSSTYVETLNLYKVAMGEYGEAAYDYANKVSDAMGIDPADWMRNEGIFMTLTKGFGVVGDRAALMSQQMTQLGYDLASFFNIRVEDAMLKIQSGISGELEPLRRLGYDLSNAKLEAVALSLGIGKSVSAMTQAEKAELRYYAIMTQVTDAHGDMARTLDAPANQLRILSAQIKQLGRDLGNIFIPILNKVLPYVIAATKALREMVGVFTGLFGIKMADIDWGDSATQNTASNLEAAGDAAKKLKSHMMGFDELNVISQNDDGEEGSTGLGFDFELPQYDFLEGLVATQIEEITGKMKEWLGITEEIGSWSELFETRLGKILIIAGAIGATMLAWKVGSSVIDFITHFDKFAGGLKTIGALGIIAAAITGAAWLVTHTEDTVTKIGGVVAGAFLAVGAILAFTGANIPLGIALMGVGALTMGTAIALNSESLSEEVKGAIAKVTSAVSLALLAVGAILAFSGANIPLGIALMAGGALAMGTAIIPKWDTLSEPVKEAINELMVIVGGAALAVGAILAFSGANIPLGIGLMLVGATSLGTALALNWDAVSKALKGPIGKITAIVSGALLVLGAILAFTGVALPLGIALMVAGAAGLATVIALNWDAIVDKIKPVIASILSILSGAMLVLGALLLLSGAGIGLGLALIFGALKLSETAWKLDDNPVTRFVKKMMNGVVNIVNGMIEGINNLLHWKFDGLVVAGVEIIPAFDIQVLKIPKIPLMAEGGFPNQGQMFIAREAGAEMVGSIGRRTAVANNDQIVAGIAHGVAEANDEQNALLREQNALLQALLEKESGVYLDGKSLTNSVERYQRERGRVLVTGGVI